jgi:hypothetical protein
MSPTLLVTALRRRVHRGNHTLRQCGDPQGDSWCLARLNSTWAPKECWPSTWEFRNILFKAGQHQGQAAEKYLERIPDVDLRLFAQIELCAGIAGLPQIAGSTVRRPSKRKSPSPTELDQIFGPTMPGIRCPKCKWTPRAMCRWCCKCEHQWNTFDTRGLCPGCGYQWESTACPQCGAMSPHSEWYVLQ